MLKEVDGVRVIIIFLKYGKKYNLLRRLFIGTL